MGANFYAGLVTTAGSLIAQYGRDVIIKHTDVTFHEEFGDADTNTTTTTVKAVVAAFEQKYVDNNNVLQGDLKLVFTANGALAPKVGDLVIIDGATYNIITVAKVVPATTVIVYSCQLRA